MFAFRTKNRKAISVVMTTLIILVSSVVLGTGVVLYGTSLFQTAGQTQSISTQSAKLWVNNTANTGYGWGAVSVRNNGDVLATINTIQIRGVTVPFTNWYADTDPTRTNANFQANLNITKEDNNGNPKGSAATGWNPNPATGLGACTQSAAGTNPTICIVVQEVPPSQVPAVTPVTLSQQSGPISLQPGAKAIIYFKMPNGLLTPVDSGSSVTLNLFAGNVGGPQTVTVANP
jgi:hypothetical protein